MKGKKWLSLTLAAALGLGLLSGCSNAPAGGDAGTPQPSGSGSLEGTTITVAASPTPHAEILAVARDVLAQQGITLEIMEFTDYIQPNLATEEGEVDANYFQHITYLNDFNEGNGTHLVSVAEIHYEPFGLYAGKTASLDALPDGAQIAVPNDATNEARALLLLEQEGLITLDRVEEMLTAAMEGTDPYTEKVDILRGIASLDSTLLYLVCDASVEENTVGELIENGTTVSIGTLPAGNAADMLMDLVFQEYGVTAEELSGGSVYVADGSALTDAYSDRHFDLVTLNRALPNASLTEIMSGRDSKILGIEEDIAQALADKYDWEIVTIPAGTYPGQDEDVLTVGMKTVLIVREDCPDAVAYFLAKTMYENKDYFETVQTAYEGFDRDDMVNNLTVPVHPGAEIYWKEIGLME